jgi:hypothetical protein
MGVPNLYRWLSERYPLINRAVDETMPMPEVDNFYLDANGILHKSTHGDAGVQGAREPVPSPESPPRPSHHSPRPFAPLSLLCAQH